MAKTYVFTDDIDGSSDDVKTYHFAFGEAESMVTWEIDLGADNYQKLEDALKPFLDKAREPERSRNAGPLTTTRRRAVSSTSGTDRNKKTQKGSTPDDIRAWAREADIKVSDRGRFSDDLIGQWNFAHPDDLFIGKEHLVGKA